MMNMPAAWGMFGSPPYLGSEYDGANDYGRAIVASPPADGKKVTVSFWVRFKGGDTAAQRVLQLHTTGSPSFVNLSVNRASGAAGVGGQFGIAIRTGTNTLIIGRNSVGNWGTGSGAIHVLFSCDAALATNSFRFYINGVAEPAAVATNANIGFSNTTLLLGALDGVMPTNLLNACLQDVFIHNDWLDLSVAANRQKFRTAGGLRVNLGANGDIPFGVQPPWFFPEGDPRNNKGYAGSLSLTGALGVCSDLPAIG